MKGQKLTPKSNPIEFHSTEEPDESPFLELFYQIEEEDSGLRIDVFLTRKMNMDQTVTEQYGTVSRAFIQKLIQDKQVSIQQKPVKSNAKLSPGMTVTVTLMPAKEPDILPENIPLDILYEDEDVLLVNKPKGMVVHPAAGHYSNTLVNALMFHCKGNLSGINGVLRPGIVHRIDMDTTGVLIVCKNDLAHQKLSEQLKVHSITRKYRAIVHGRIAEDTCTIHTTIGRHKTDRKKMAVNVPNGKEAITHIKVLKRFQKYTYIECTLETGRTHQIRVHLASIHHPLLGDTVYGRQKEEFNLQGQTLHAMVLGFVHPKTGQYMEVQAPLPDYFSNLLNILK